VAAWVPYHRVDTLAIPFAVAAYGSAAADKRRGLVAAAVLIAAGSLVKQTVALAALPILIHLAITRRFRPAAAFAVGVALLGGGLWLAVDRLSGGYFLTVAIHGNVNRLAVIEGLRLAVGFLQSPTVLVGLLAAAWLLYHEAPMAVGSLYWVALVVSTLLAVPAAMKEGAAINYFLEPAALAAIVIGVHGLPRLAAVYPTRITAALGLLALLVAIPGVGSFPLKWEPRPAPPELPPAICERLRSGSHGQPPLVLADSCCVDAVLAAGAEPVVNDPLLFRFMVDNGTVEAQPLLAALNAGRVRWLWLHRPVDLHRAAVGLSVQRWPATVIEAMERRYAVVTRKPGLAVYQFQAKTAGAQE